MDKSGVNRLKAYRLKVEIGKMRLRNPVMAASGTFGYGEEFKDLIDLKVLGAIVTKTITLMPRPGNPMPRVCETSSGMLNAIGLQNEGVGNFIDEKLPYLSRIGTCIIVSISGDSIQEFCKLARRLDKEKAVNGIELNISCPNVKAQGLIAQDANATHEVVKEVREVTDKTLITKLSPNVTDIVDIAQAACKGGADAVSLVNTFFGMAIDIETGRPRLGNIKGGLSGPCIKPIALRMVWDVARNISKPVIGMGGIMCAEDAIEFLLAGAKAIGIGTANLVEPGVSGEIIKGIKEYYSSDTI